MPRLARGRWQCVPSRASACSARRKLTVAGWLRRQWRDAWPELLLYVALLALPAAVFAGVKLLEIA